MKKFILHCSYFLIPAIVIFLSLEVYLTFSINTFNQKANFLKQNLSEIEVLVLGTSHHQNAINPKYISLKTANMAYGGQDKRSDAEILFKYAEKMPNLKILVLETDYITYNIKTASNYFRIPWYYRFHGLEIHELSLIKKLSLYASSPTFFNNYISDNLSPFTYKYNINTFGFIENDFPGIFMEQKYKWEELKEHYRFELDILRKNQSNQNFQYNTNIIIEIINYCNKNNIKLVFSQAPVFVKPEDFIDERLYQEYNEILNSLVSKYPIYQLNWKKDIEFELTDFKNFTHLNSNGARKFSLLLNAELNNLNNAQFD